MPAVQATLEVEERDGLILLSVQGEIDASNVEQLQRAIALRLDRGRGAVALDLSGVAYLDSAGVGMLFALAQESSARGERLRIVAPREAPIRRILYLCDIAAVADVDEAP